jgi:hypothetical protein
MTPRLALPGVVAVAAVCLLACGAAGDPTNQGPSNGNSGSGVGEGGTQCSSAGNSAGNSGSSTGGGGSLPLGVYADCSITQTSGGGSGSISGAGGTLTLTQAGSVLTATYTDSASGSLEFVGTTDTSASLRAPGQTFNGLQAECGGGGLPVPVAAGLSVSAGELTYDASTLFMSVVGTFLTPDAGVSCQIQPGSVTVTITCSKG